MPHFNKENLSKIAQALKDHGYAGLANTIYWWNSISIRDRKLLAGTSSWNAMRKPLKDMPLFLNHSDETVKIIAATRLKLVANT